MAGGKSGSLFVSIVFRGIARSQRAWSITCSYPPSDIKTVPMTPDDTTWFVQQVFVHDAKVRAYLGRLNVRPHDIPDIVQEAYIRVWTLRPGTRPQNPLGFLFSVAHNLWCDRRKRLLDRRTALTNEFDNYEACRDNIDPERRVIAERELAAFNRALASLPAKRRQAYWLKRVHDLSIKEVSQYMQISPNTVEQHVTVALRVLRNKGLQIAPRARSAAEIARARTRKRKPIAQISRTSSSLM